MSINYVADSGFEFIFYIGLVSQADTKLLQVNPTIAAGDFKVSIDGGAFNNLTTLPAVTPAGGRAVKITVSATEMTGTNIFVQCVDAAGAEWCDNFINISTVPSPADVRQIDRAATNGYNADLKLRSLQVVNSAGHAIIATGGSNGSGLIATGNGTASGIITTGGSTGNGFSAVGGSTSGSGGFFYGQTFGSGIDAQGVGSGASGILAHVDTGNGYGFSTLGHGNSHGVRAEGGATGDGVNFIGGATSGNGFYAAAVGGGYGMASVGVGAVSILATQGISGPLDASVYTSISDALLKRDMSAVTGEASRSLLNCLRIIRNKWSFSGNTMTITKEDDTTAAWTATVTTSAAAEPIISFDGA